MNSLKLQLNCKLFIKMQYLIININKAIFEKTAQLNCTLILPNFCYFHHIFKNYFSNTLMLFKYYFNFTLKSFKYYFNY